MKLNGYDAYYRNGKLHLEDKGEVLISGSFEEVSKFLKFREQKRNLEQI